jgi:hypothetical protein
MIHQFVFAEEGKDINDELERLKTLVSHIPFIDTHGDRTLVLDQNNMCPACSQVLKHGDLYGFVYAQSETESFMMVLAENFVSGKEPLDLFANIYRYATFYKVGLQPYWKSINPSFVMPSENLNTTINFKIVDTDTKKNLDIISDQIKSPSLLNELLNELLETNPITLEKNDMEMLKKAFKITVNLTPDKDYGTILDKIKSDKYIKEGSPDFTSPGGMCDVCSIKWDMPSDAPPGIFPLTSGKDEFEFWCANACVPFLKKILVLKKSKFNIENLPVISPIQDNNQNWKPRLVSLMEQKNIKIWEETKQKIFKILNSKYEDSGFANYLSKNSGIRSKLYLNEYQMSRICIVNNVYHTASIYYEPSRKLKSGFRIVIAENIYRLDGMFNGNELNPLTAMLIQDEDYLDDGLHYKVKSVCQFYEQWKSDVKEKHEAYRNKLDQLYNETHKTLVDELMKKYIQLDSVSS